MSNPDVNREAAHRRYDAAYEAAASQGQYSQAAVNDAYWNLYQNADWTPDESWGQQFQGDLPVAWRYQEVPQYQAPTYQNNIPSASSYQVTPVEDPNKVAEARSMIIDESKPSVLDQILDDQRSQIVRDRSLNPVVELRDKAMEFAEGYQGSQQQLADLERAFQEEQERELQESRDEAANQLYSQYAMTGINPYDDPLFAQGLQSINDNMDQQSWLQAERNRRFSGDGTNFESNPFNWNLLGFTSQRQTPQAARNLYDFHFAQEDARGNNGSVSEGSGNASNTDFWNEKILDSNAIDNGMSPDSREALFMTGEQYIKYRDQFGLPGRDVDDIDPNEIYSKQDEQDKYGFIPYITSEESRQQFHDSAAPHAVSNVFNRLANARRENTDFDVNFDGRTFSGHDLIKNGNLWWNRNQGKAASADVVTDPSQVTEDSVPYTYVLTDSNGNRIFAKSALVNAYIDEQNRPIMQFEDGDIWTFDDMNDYQQSLGEAVAEDGGYVAYWKNLDPLVLDDGTKIRADKAEQLLSQSNYQNFADYGDFNFNKPYIDDPFLDDQGNFNLNPAENSFLPWITDTALGSVPYFFRPTAAAQGISDAMGSSTGFQPGYQDFLNGTYSLLSDDPTREEQLSATLGSLAMPVTEHLWGNIGGRVLSKPLMKAIGKNEADIKPLLRYGMGAVGEGLEEIPGNIVEPIKGGSGVSGWYADQMYRDADGNLTTEDTGTMAYDNQGNPIVNRNTDMVSRARNFVQDIPLAFIGGATMGATLGAPSIKSYYNEYAPRRQEREEFGNNMLRPEFDADLLVGLTDQEREYYNR